MKICSGDTILPHADASKTVAKPIYKATITPPITHCCQVRILTYQRHTALQSLSFYYGDSHVLRNFGKAAQNKVPTPLNLKSIRHHHYHSVRNGTKETNYDTRKE
jgi:hypothetical protein